MRLAFNGQNSQQTEALALQAKTLGFYTEIGNDGQPNLGNYATGVVAEAKWAEANHIDQMSIGNEADSAGANQPILANISCQAKAVAPNVVISYDTYKGSYDPITSWAANMGCLDKLGLNLYADYANTMAEANNILGASHFYVSETNLDCGYNNSCGSEVSWAAGLQKVLNIEQPYGVKINVFAYRCAGSACPAYWTIIGHLPVMAVLGL